MLDSKEFPLTKAFHKHKPIPTGKVITAGFRKGNEPCGNYAVMCQGQMYVCRCGEAWVGTQEYGLVPIYPETYDMEDAA